VNPPDKPFTGSLRWEPRTPSSGFGGSNAIFGFNALRIERGRFRQDLPFENGAGSIEVGAVGMTSPAGSEGWPLLSAFRPLQNPSLYRGVPPSDPFAAEGAGLEWNASLRTPSRLSAVTFRYELTIDIRDPELPKHLESEEDQRALLAYLQDPQANPRPKLDLSKLAFGKLTVTQGGEDKEFPEVETGQPRTQIALTGFHDDRPAPKTVTIRFGAPTANNPTDFATASALKISQRHKFETMRLKITKVMLFDAQRVNVPYKNLPCSHLSYSFPVSFSVIVGGQLNGTLWYPNIGTTPTLYVKLFSPDQTSGSSGFAHAISLRFLLFALPQNIGPGSTSGGVVGANSGGGEIYRAIFIGPTPSTRSLRYTLTGQAVKNAPGRVVAYDRFPIQESVTDIAIDKSGHVGTSPPPSNTDWSLMAELPVGPHRLDANGPNPSPYLHLDVGASRNAWYRTRQRATNGAEIISQPFQNSVYSERAVMRMTTSALASAPENREMAVRRPTLVSSLASSDPLQAPPIALFWADDDRLLVTNAPVGNGLWSLALRARQEDPSSLVDTHLVARVWLVPENLSPNSDLDVIQSFQDKYELSFVSGDRGLVRLGGARSMSELMVSPPVSGELQMTVLGRYVEGVDGEPDGRLKFDFGPNVRGRLVVGLYHVSFPTSQGDSLGYDPFARRAPRLFLEIDSDSGYVDTTIQQTLSAEIQPLRYERYAGTKYEEAPKPLWASRNLHGGGSLQGEGFVPYAGKLDKYDAKNPGNAALRSVAVFSSAETAVNVFLPFKEIPQEPLVEDAAVRGDFTTLLPLSAGGRVRTGRWTLRMNVDVGADEASIETSYRFEVFLATASGRISYRIFRSPVLNRNGDKVEHVVDVNLPFGVTEANTEIIVRVSAYPRSKGSAPISVDELKNRYPDLQIGARIKELSLVTHTYDVLKIDQTDSLAGSPAFYEDLPTVPGRTIGGQSFIFVADENLTREVFLTRGQDWKITGALYSATWQVALPKNVEARVVSQSIGESTVHVRTVPTTVEDEKVSLDRRISAMQDRVSGSLHLAYQSIKKGLGIQSEDSDIRYAILGAYGQKPRLEEQVLDGRGRAMPGSIPDITLVRRGGGHEGGDVFAVSSQLDGDTGTDLQVAISDAAGEPKTWSAPLAPYGGDAFAAPHRLVRGLQLCTTRPGAVDQSSLTVGWVEPGAVMLRRTSIIDAKRTGVGEGEFFLVDGDSDVDMAYEQKYVRPAAGLSGPAYRTFPGLASLPGGLSMIVYGLDGRPGQAFARLFDGTAIMGGARVCASLAGAGVPVGSEHEFRGFTLAWAEDGNEGVLAFWCKGRIMIAPIEMGPEGFRLHPIQLVAGPRDVADDPVLQAAVLPSVRRLIVSQLGDAEPEVNEQAPGVVVARGFGMTGSVLVFYEDSDEQRWGREVIIGGVTKPRYKWSD
jgi:hypothetical protein